MTISVKNSRRRLATIATAMALACSALLVCTPTAEAKRLRMLPGTGKTSAPAANARPAAAAPTQAVAPTPVRAATQPATRSAAPSAPAAGMRPAVFFGIGSAQAAPAASEDATASRRAAEPAQLQRASTVEAASLNGRALPVLGQGGGEGRRVPGFEVLN